ncbi:class I SAM-dependent methyltransferase [Candidatus Falkowbacteria bacterium]|nr:class I SAM-dependent methyltransferase [Candidatus Falkowbacteria bacterium]
MAISGGAQFLNPKEILEKVSLIEGMKVADLGCGNLGYFIIPAAKIVGKTGAAYAVDILKTALESVRSRAKLEGLTNLETVWANLEDPATIKIPAGTLDVIFLKNVLFQNKKHKEIVSGAVKLLKKGGKIIIVDWKKIGIPFGPPVDIRIDKENIKAIVGALNLRLVEETEFGEYFWGLVYQK